MRTRGPIVTLLSVVVLAFALLAVNMFSGRTRAVDDAAHPADPTPAALAAPPPSAPTAFPDRVSYAGRTSGRKAGEATVEIAIRNGTATGYLCDGAKLESWLHGTVSGSSVTLRGKGSDELTAELRPAGADGGRSLAGSVTLAGSRWLFTAAPGGAPTAERRADQNGASAPAPGAPTLNTPSAAPNAGQAAPNVAKPVPAPRPVPPAAPDDAGATSGSGGY
jgi:hypothetical protein